MFSQSNPLKANPFDKLLENATDPNLLEVNWGLIIEICDQITNEKVTPKYALSAIRKKILSSDPHVSLYALQLLDACVSNCGLSFHLEVCSREFEYHIIQILAKGHPIVVEKMKEYIKKWSEQEFKNNSQLSLIPALYNKLKKEGVKFKSSEPPKRKTELPTDPNVVTSNQEEEDIAKAIELSLKESSPTKIYNNKSDSSSLYPSIINGNHSTALANVNQTIAKENYKVRALYDFEAAEDNEITFKAGEVLLVLDDTDSNWWKGSNHRGEGLFPANFVTKNLEDEIETNKLTEKKSVQFNDEVNVKLLNTEQVKEIDENKINRLLHLLHEADPTGERKDSDELLQLEEQCLKMAPLIDQELEVVDKTHASLSIVNSQLVDALNIYCSLMKEDSYPAAIPQSPYAIPQQISTPQQPLPNFHQNPALNPNYSYGQTPQIQSLYSNPYSLITNNNSMAPTSTPFNHIYSSPTSDSNQTTYTVSHQLQYGDTSQQMLHQPQHNQTVDPNASVIQTSIGPPQQMVNYSPQQPTSMVSPHTNQ